MNTPLHTLRERIDAIDEDLLRLLAERGKLVLEIGRYKKANGLEPLDSKRWAEVLQSKLAQAETLDLPPEFVTALYNLIHEYSLKVEEDA